MSSSVNVAQLCLLINLAVKKVTCAARSGDSAGLYQCMSFECPEAMAVTMFGPIGFYKTDFPEWAW